MIGRIYPCITPPRALPIGSTALESQDLTNRAWSLPQYEGYLQSRLTARFLFLTCADQPSRLHDVTFQVYIELSCYQPPKRCIFITMSLSCCRASKHSDIAVIRLKSTFGATLTKTCSIREQCSSRFAAIRTYRWFSCICMFLAS